MGDKRETDLRAAAQESLNVSLEVGIDGRWDALALSELLIPYRSFLVQLNRERWVVHARVPGWHGESLDDALGAIGEWLVDRELDDVSCRVEGRPYRLGERGAA